MRILLVNPNTSTAMTAAIAAAARAVAAPATEVIAAQPGFGPRSIEGHFDEAVAAAGVAELVHRAPAHDAVVIACFGDPGLDAAREVTAAPVLGIAEAALHAAAMLASGFSVVTTLVRTCAIAERLVQRYGFTAQCRGVHGTDIPVLDLECCSPDTLARLEQTAREALERDRSGVIVLGCAGMAALAATLQQRLGVPVIDGVTVALKFAESLAALGLGTSKRGDYAPPLPKVYEGWAAPLGAPPGRSPGG